MSVKAAVIHCSATVTAHRLARAALPPPDAAIDANPARRPPWTPPATWRSPRSTSRPASPTRRCARRAANP